MSCARRLFFCNFIEYILYMHAYDASLHICGLIHITSGIVNDARVFSLARYTDYEMHG